MPNTTSSLPILTQRSSQRPTLGRKGSCQQSRRQRNLDGLARAAQQQTLLTTVRVQACSHWSENVGFPSPCQSAVTMLVFSVQTHDWQGGSYASWAGRFCCSQRISSTRSVPQRHQCQFDARRVFSHERWEVSLHFGSGFQLPAKSVAGSVSAWRWHLDQTTGCIGGHSGRLLAHVSHG